MSTRKSTRKAGGRRVKDQVVETTSAALALGAQSGRLVVGAVVAAGLLLVVGEVRTASEHDTAAPPQDALVSTVAYGCPAFVQKGTAAATTIALGTLPADQGGQADQGDEGEVGSRTALRLPGGTPVRAFAEAQRGAWVTASAGKQTRALLIDADGASAPGTVAYAASSADAANGGGKAVAACPRPGAERWFVGAGTTAQQRTSLVLTNTSSGTGIVDITLYGKSGEVQSVRSTGIVVEPGESRLVRLEQLAAGETDLAARVAVRRGAVAVAATDVAAQGSEFLPAAAEPATEQTVVGVPAASGARTMLVANPGDRTATVQVTIATNDGVFTPSGLESVDVPPGSVGTVRLPASISTKAYAVRLGSDVPITASVRTTVGDDHAYGAAAPSWEGTAVMPLRVGGVVRPDDARLLVTAADERPATLEVSAHDADGAELGSTTLDAPAGATVSLNPFGAGGVGVAEGKVAYLSVRTAKGTVYAAAAYTRGGIAVTPLRPAPVREAAPVVRPGAP